MRENATKSNPDRRIAVYLFAVLVCVFLGPFGTAEDLVFWDRVVFWTVCVSAVGFFMEFCILTALHSPILGKAHFSIRLIIGATVGGLPGASMVSFVNLVMRPEHMAASEFPEMWAKVSFLALIIAGLDLLTQPKDIRSRILNDEKEAREPDEVAPSEPVRGPTGTPLTERLSPPLRLSRVLSLSMQDHYVEVTTTKGSEMLLMRLSDAIDLLGDQKGAQTHRSHWVSEEAASKLVRDGRRYCVRLTDGRSLPVSKNYLGTVETLLAQKERQA